jgi:hypothetical protein
MIQSDETFVSNDILHCRAVWINFFSRYTSVAATFLNVNIYKGMYSIEPCARAKICCSFFTVID